MNLDLVRNFLLVVELGSLNQAAERLQVAQSTLTRQIQTLEDEVGGRLFDRRADGMALTAAGHALLDGVRPLLARFDHVLAEARATARGQSTQLRLAYIASATAAYLHPALAAMRAAHPEVKVRLLDQSPGEQIAGLRAGSVDLALLGCAGVLLRREFYVRVLARVPVWLALSADHPLAARDSVTMSELQAENFVGAAEADMPGFNAWLQKLGRAAGYRPRVIADAQSLADGLALVVAESAVKLVPAYVAQTGAAGVVFRPLRGAETAWSVMIAWQRGKSSPALKTLLAAFP